MQNIALEWIIPLIILGYILLFVQNKNKKKGSSKNGSHTPLSLSTHFDFTPNQNIISKEFIKFFKLIEAAAAPAYIVFGKVRVSDIIKLEPSECNHPHNFRYQEIATKEFDMVVCDFDMKVVAIISLNEGNIATIPFIQTLCDESGIPLIRFDLHHKRKWTVENIRMKMFGEELFMLDSTIK